MKYSVTLTGIPNFNEVTSCVFEPLNSYKVQRLLDGLDLKTGADGRTRTLYSLRHFYATLNLERGVTTHALSRQLGNSTEMIDKHYSKYSPLLNAELHSGRRTFITNAAKKISSVGGSLRDVQMLAGHSSLAVTQRYIEGDGEARVKVVDII